MDLWRGREMAQRQIVDFVVWTVGAATVGVLPSFALPSLLGQTFLVCLGVEACVSACRVRATEGRWRPAGIVILVRLWAAGLFIGAGRLKAAYSDVAASINRVLSGPVEQTIIAICVAAVAWAALRWWLHCPNVRDPRSRGG